MFTQLAYVKIKLNKEDKNFSIFNQILASIASEASKCGYYYRSSQNLIIEPFVEEFYLYNFLDVIDGKQYPIIIATNNIEYIDLEKSFNCKDNIKAFFKIIAMRDDTDMNQYFVDEDGAEWINLGMRIEPGSLEKCLTEKKIVCFNSPKTHRASAQEIFNFFEKNKDSKL